MTTIIEQTERYVLYREAEGELHNHPAGAKLSSLGNPLSLSLSPSLLALLIRLSTNNVINYAVCHLDSAVYFLLSSVLYLPQLLRQIRTVLVYERASNFISRGTCTLYICIRWFSRSFWMIFLYEYIDYHSSKLSFYLTFFYFSILIIYFPRSNADIANPVYI